MVKKRVQFLVHFDKSFFLVVTLIGLGLPVFWLIQLGLEGHLSTSEGWIVLAGGAFYAIGYTVVISMITSLVWNYVQRTIPWEKGQIAKRIITELLATNVVAVASMVVLTYLDILIFGDDGKNPIKLYKENIQITVIMNLIVVLVFESIGFFMRWKESLVENEKLAQANAESQFQSLKNQLNPHFLFNSLNTLSSLVHSDAEKAEIFIDEFAQVYRYVLDVSDQKYVTLEDEIEFAKSFIYLHQIRFGESLEYSMDIQLGDEDKLMAPLTLQILVENAIKHNTISQEQPLQIAIASNGRYISVTNNLTPRPEQVKSTQLGQKNIIQRYSFLIDEVPIFQIRAKEYVVQIPLILGKEEF